MEEDAPPSGPAAAKRRRLGAPQRLRDTLLSARDLLATAGPLVLLALALLVAAYWVLNPNPPRRVVMATGSERGAYAEIGKRYADQLKRHGISVELRHTQGAAENLALLRDPKSGVDVAFIQGGSEEASAGGTEMTGPLLQSLGSLFHEPVWLFYREAAAQAHTGAPRLTALKQLEGWRLNIGPTGSGTAPLMKLLLDDNGVSADRVSPQREGQTPAVMALLDGSSDALVFVSAPESLMVQMLLRTPGIALFRFEQAEAYARRHAFLNAVRLPRGVVDLAADQPPADVPLVAATGALVAREGTHPALVQLLVQAARQVHGEAGWFQRRGDFPNPQTDVFPLHPEAERFYRNGTPWLQRYLPFWLANLVDRMWVVLLSIVAVLIPLSRVVPPLYEFRIRSRVFRWYGQLRSLEAAVGQRSAAELLDELDQLDNRVGRITLPLSYADELYALRAHIELVRQRVRGAG
ncbi:TRAP-type uncharacterized transport system, periplasmic component [Burkholderiales bacterium JOSHI_001]|nr:TRAP-type uncharacterized transport system, periplasmic component [Burkholderiales bacterium JOSHI_001]